MPALFGGEPLSENVQKLTKAFYIVLYALNALVPPLGYIFLLVAKT
jgi:hypothetical protein